ncbi:type II toxin-antitoxin system VapC family toxin [Vacuolonema iberomarrocanum]|uniref:type II toxin-antitoxin system VapC family toxin n=1 Tax=Vacuolonema iberomarrocanum TaxID=3454632 RepID=UPI001A060590|nr:type II toxin-antitoxin system VapC family toxin [filamentous cyanobacterium LEGE 07170]
MSESVFVDTWGWLTLNDAGERRHSDVARFYQRLIQQQTPIYTTTFVLDETFTLFFKRLNPVQAQRSMVQLSNAFLGDRFHLIQIDAQRFSQTQSLRLKYLDKPHISFTDFTSMVVMQEFKINCILTEDAHFIQVGFGFKRLP